MWFLPFHLGEVVLRYHWLWIQFLTQLQLDNPEGDPGSFQLRLSSFRSLVLGGSTVDTLFRAYMRSSTFLAVRSHFLPTSLSCSCFHVIVNPV